MKLYHLTTCICLFFFDMLQAQPLSNDCSSHKQKSFPQYSKTTIAAPAEADYDVKHVKLDLQLNHRNAWIAGSVTTAAEVQSSQLKQYVFELYRSFTIDSVKVNNELQSFDTANSICTVTVISPLPHHAIFSAQVFYHGFAPKYISGGPGSSSGPGYINNGYDVSFSLSEPYSSYLWWPCKQAVNDKIDSADIWVTTDDSVKVGSNGLLESTDSLGNHQVTYKWKERYPIAYYLISVALSNYREYSGYMHFSNSTDSMQMINYLPPGWMHPSELTMYQQRVDSMEDAINYYSTVFGRYPFWKEKYGHSYIPTLGMAMEHQTMTSANLWSTIVLAHELAHQWFGDNVTCGTWSDIWLNEGIATYGEYLFSNKFYGKKRALSFLQNLHRTVLSEDTGSVYVYDTTDPSRIFDARLTYYKGGSVTHMLRFVFNNDSLFFAFLTGYQNKFAGKSATTKDFKILAESYLHQDLDVFFDQWIYKEGYPTYYSSWNQDNNVFFLKINQQTSVPASVFNFVMPIAVKLYSQQGDTTIRVYNDQPSQVYHFIMDRAIDSIAIDPNEDLLRKQGGMPLYDSTLNTLPAQITIYPNPVNNVLNIAYKNLQEPTLLLFDISGRKLMEYKFRWPSGIEQVDVHMLPNAVYVYRIMDKGAVKAEGKFLKQ